MQREDYPGKAEGSSAPTKPYKYHVSASRPQQSHRTAQRPPTHEEQQSQISSEYHTEHYARSHRMSFLEDQHFASPSPPSQSHGHNSDEDDHIDDHVDDHAGEWDIINRPEPVQSSTNPQNTSQSYDFPGTWPAAVTDTKAALTQVGAATASYASALTRSGIGKASLSIGTALTNTATNNAYSLAAWAIDRTGTGHSQLPRPIGRWMKSRKEHEDEARKAKARRLRQRGLGDGNGDRPMYDEPHVFKDDESHFVIDQHLMDSRSLDIVESMCRVHQGAPPVRAEEEMWRLEMTRAGYGDEVEDMEELGGDEMEEGGPVLGTDGLLRQFQFDD